MPMQIQDAYDRMEQLQRNLRVAFALAAYRNDHIRFPQQLGDLVPKYMPTIPGDLFSGKTLIYRASDRVYLLYSVGVNGKDEAGGGDDLKVYMSLPEPKPPEPNANGNLPSPGSIDDTDPVDWWTAAALIVAGTSIALVCILWLFVYPKRRIASQQKLPSPFPISPGDDLS